MKPTLKINFTDMWGYDNFIFNPRDNYFTDLLSLKYDVVIDDNPDVLFYSVFGNSNRNYNCKKVYFCGENTGNNFKHPSTQIFDASLTHFEESDTNYYLPLWIIFVNWFNKSQPRPLPSNPTYSVPLKSLYACREPRLRTNFCCFINNNPINDRIELFNNLNSYKRVDSYGQLFNNVGQPLRGSEEAKLNVITQYKFTIAFENSYHDGYNTEKIIQPLATNCIPIYSGGSRVKEFFNPNSFIYANDFKSINELAEYVKYVDQNDDLYLKYIKSSPFIDNKIPNLFEPETILNWLCAKLEI